MPLAPAHMAVGLLTESTIEKPKTTTLKRLFILFLLVNSPDVDIVISWLATGSYYTYHRTFAHSILFAVIPAVLFSNLFRLFPFFPKLSYKWCYWVVISHLLADYLFSPWETAFLCLCRSSRDYSTMFWIMWVDMHIWSGKLKSFSSACLFIYLSKA